MRSEHSGSGGYRLVLPHISRSTLAAHLGAFLAQPHAVYGLVENLAAAAWIAGQNGAVQLYRVHLAGADLRRAYRRLAVETVAATNLPGHWPQGRLFDRHVEWRWRAQGSEDYALMGLSENVERLKMAPDPSIVDLPPAEDGWHTEATTWHLVGSTIVEAGTGEESSRPLVAHAWREVRYPYPLFYPAAHNGDRNLQPRLAVRIYRDGHGHVRFTRFCGLHTDL